MNNYFSTFITGFSEVIRSALITYLKDAKIKLLLDGLVVYTTNASIETVRQIRFLNNSFLLLKMLENLPGGQVEKVEKMARQFLKDPHSLRRIPNYYLGKNRSFRVIASQENRLVSLNSNLLKTAEEKIKEATRLAVNRSKPDVEFWFLLRREGFGFIGLRLTKKPNYEKTLERGELRPELTHLLCLLSEPRPSDIFLDPFAGYGAIPIERAIAFPYQQIFAGDIDQKLVERLKIKTKRFSKKIIVDRWDAQNLSFFQKASVDKIATDPPWGLFQKASLDLGSLYSESLEEFARILKPGGLLIILTAQKGLIAKVLEKLYPRLEIIQIFNTLVSGQKAGVYKIKKLT